ncbi:hypothetical protein A0H81_05815 [Grifola frondosa]|uniref:Uncharacterized protein n=1 Tax=Grifola frondosa TaxID=5627 RepID=A0A1C7MBT7_GRIFR|nr:hypothetical protein A0H81_05815 [Grifola frondosa]
MEVVESSIHSGMFSNIFLLTNMHKLMPDWRKISLKTCPPPLLLSSTGHHAPLPSSRTAPLTPKAPLVHACTRITACTCSSAPRTTFHIHGYLSPMLMPICPYLCPYLRDSPYTHHLRPASASHQSSTLALDACSCICILYTLAPRVARTPIIFYLCPLPNSPYASHPSFIHVSVHTTLAAAPAWSHSHLSCLHTKSQHWARTKCGIQRTPLFVA